MEAEVNYFLQCVILISTTNLLELFTTNILTKRAHTFSQHLSFPKEFKVMIGQGYTLKLQISKENIEKNSDLFLAVDMYPGFEYEEPKIQQGYSVQQSDSYTAQVNNYYYFVNIYDNIFYIF